MTLIEIGIWIATFGVLLVAIFGTAKAISRNKANSDSRRGELAEREIALIVEDTQATALGAISIIVIIVIVIGAVFAYASARTVFQQIEVSGSFIAGLILFGLGAALGRRRTYRVYRIDR